MRMLLFWGVLLGFMYWTNTSINWPAAMFMGALLWLTPHLIIGVFAVVAERNPEWSPEDLITTLIQYTLIIGVLLAALIDWITGR